jgi:adenylyltransferase/sulfurtransferase
VFLLDVREPNEWQIAKIPGATLLPLSELPQRWRELEPRKGKPMVVHCKSGVRSKKAIAFLQQQGFTGLKNMAGGILQWSEQVDPSVPKY